jgi:signal transduction histidine kinase
MPDRARTTRLAEHPAPPLEFAPDRAVLRNALSGLLHDLGFETASVFVRSAAGWELLERLGPVRAWHAVLDPSVLEGSPEAAEYPDVRTIAGAGPRLAALGCASVATLPLADGSRVLLDSAAPCSADGWIERARPYLDLLAIMSGPAWPAGGAVRGHDELATMQRVFSACQHTLRLPGATVDHLLGQVREALHADELFLLIDLGADLGVVSSDAEPSALHEAWPHRLPRRAVLESPPDVDGRLDHAAMQRLALELSLSSRALAGAFGRQDGDVEILVAGWADGPALSPVSMTVVARAVSTAKAALQARAQAITTLVDRERTRIAFALHDGLTQTVAGAVLQLEALHKVIERDPEEALQALDNSKREIRRSLAELRGILFDLSQTEEDGSKSPEPLTRYVEDVVRRWRLPARVAVEGDLSDVPSRTLSVAYVVIREALANAAKHAAARNVTVRLSAGEHDLVVTVGDSGPGFTHRQEEAAREAHHVGLDLLRRRVREVGGRLRVESQPGKGTRIIARLPIRGEAS